jgi:hypothetical protein
MPTAAGSIVGSGFNDTPGSIGSLVTLRWRKAHSNPRSHLTVQYQKRDGSPYGDMVRPALARLLQLEEQPAAAP